MEKKFSGQVTLGGVILRVFVNIENINHPSIFRRTTIHSIGLNL